MDGSTRIRNAFNRKSRQYAPGNHAVSLGGEFENTTGKGDCGFLLAQSKVFFTSNLGFKAYAERSSHWLPFEGVAEDHARWEDIRAAMATYATGRNVRSFVEFKNRFEGEGVDGLAVVEDRGKIVDFVVLRAPVTTLANELKRSTSWLSLSEAFSEAKK